MEINTKRRTKVNEIISAIDSIIALVSRSPMEALDQISLVSLDAIRTLYTNERLELNKLVDQILKDAVIDCKHEEVVKVTDSDHSRTICRCNKCNSYFGSIPEGSKVVSVEER